MSALTWIALIFLLGSLAVTRAMCREFLMNPFVCFFGLWTAAGLLYDLDRFFGYFVLPVDLQGTLLFVLSFASFFFGAVVGLAPLRLRSRAIGVIDSSQVRVLLVATAVILLIFVAGVAWKVLFVTRIVGLPFAHLASIRAAANTGEFTLPLGSRIMTLAGYVAALNLAVLEVFRPALSTGIAVIGVILASFVNDSTVGMRGSTATTVLLFASTAVVAVGAKTGKTGLRHLLGGGGLLLAGLLLVGVILYVRSNSPISFGQRLLLDTYLAIAGQIPSTGYFLTHPWPAGLPCEYTCSGLYQLVDIPMRYFLKDGGVLLHTTFSPSAPILRVHDWTFNTAAYVAYFYADARAFGVGAFSLLLGYASARTFSRAIIQPTFLSIQIGALMMSVVVFSVRGVLTGVVFWGCIAFIIVQQRVVAFAARSWMQPKAGREPVVEPSAGIFVPTARSDTGETGAPSTGFVLRRLLRSEYLTKLLLGCVIVSLFLDMGFLSWQHTSSKTPLYHAEARIAGLLRDAIAQLHTTSTDRRADLAIVKQVRIVFSPQSATLAELENTGTGWRRVSTAASLTLPDGVVVQSWTFPTNAIEAWVYGDGVVETRAGILRLRARDGAAADVWIGPNGTVWY